MVNRLIKPLKSRDSGHREVYRFRTLSFGLAPPARVILARPVADGNDQPVTECLTSNK